MLVLYYPPFRAADDIELLDMSVIGARAYVEDLEGFEPDAIAEGWRRCRRLHKVERWPTLQEWASQVPVRSSPHAYAAPTQARASDWEKRAEADRLWPIYRANKVGETAANEGWMLTLKVWLLQEGREPTNGELRAMRRGALEARERTARRLAELEDGPLKSQLLGVREAMLERESKLAVEAGFGSRSRPAQQAGAE